MGKRQLHYLYSSGITKCLILNTKLSQLRIAIPFSNVSGIVFSGIRLTFIVLVTMTLCLLLELSNMSINKVILVLEVELETDVQFLQEKASSRIRTIQGVAQVNVIATGERQYDITEIKSQS